MKSKLLTSQILLLLAVCSVNLYAVEKKDYSPFPNPNVGYVTDIAGLLTNSQKEQLQSWLYTTEKNTGVEIIVVTIYSLKDYPGTPNNSIEDFAKDLFDAYKIGNMPKNNGVLLLVALKDRKARIELGAGYRHSRDSDATRIMQNIIIPQFKKNHYDKGTINGVRSIIREFSGMIIIPGWIKIIVATVIPIFAVIAFSLFRKGKRGWGWICVGLIIVLILAFVRLLQKTVEALPEGSPSGGFGGGFGGGFSGGGGATGSW